MRDISWAKTILAAGVAAVVGIAMLTGLTHVFPALRDDGSFGWLAGIVAGPLVLAALWVAGRQQNKRNQSQNKVPEDTARKLADPQR